ncbi:MAG: hypothetical protein IKM06_02160 [Clostridia bacterium]|jgi:hypothetical protein|nr:hypothetical protein [Clostridia bacterium]
MNAKGLVDRALLLLGYSENYDILSVSALNAVNRVYADLFFIDNTEGFKEITELTQPVQLSERLLFDVAPYGVAAHLALSVGESDSQAYLASIYNQKRKKLTGSGTLQDVLPTV